MNYLLAILVILILVFIINRLFDNREELAVECTREPMEDINLLSAIDNVRTAEELMDIVLENNEFYGEENNVLLQKALSFGLEVCRHDWADIYDSAQDDTML